MKPRNHKQKTNIEIQLSIQWFEFEIQHVTVVTSYQ